MLASQAAGGSFSTALRGWRLLRASGDMLGEHLGLTLDLLVLEWQEERARVQRLLLLTAVATACVLLLLLFAGGFLMAAVWYTPYRIPVGGLLLAALAGGAAAALSRARSLSLHARHPFTGVREELAKDTQLVRMCTGSDGH